MKRFTVLFSLLAFLNTIKSQTKYDLKNYTEIVRDVEGDLNNDGKNDRVLVKMNIKDKTTPLLLQVFLSDKKGKLNVVISSDQIIEPQYPIEKNGKHNGFQIPDFMIEDEILLMRSSTELGNVVHEFTFKNNDFDLTNLTYFTRDNNIIVETFYNLETGLRTEVTDIYDNRTHTEKRSKKITVKAINPLPKLSNFKYTDKEKY